MFGVLTSRNSPEQPTELLMVEDNVQVEVIHQHRWWKVGVDGHVAKPLVWSKRATKSQPTFHDMPEPVS